MPAEFYNKILYPLQDRVIPLFKDTPFYLTGGTTLSRGYYNHRYSDDLDYFVNDRDDFEKIADRVISRLLNDFGDLQIAVKEASLYELAEEVSKLLWGFKKSL